MADFHAAAFVFDDWIRGATITCALEDSRFPASNLKRIQPRQRFQSASGQTDILVKAIRDDDANFNGVPYHFSNIHNEDASIRIRASRLGEMSSPGPFLDTARIFGGADEPHLYAVRFKGGTSKIDLDNGSSDMTGSWLVEATVRVFKEATSYLIFSQDISTATSATVTLTADRRLQFSHSLSGVVVTTDEALGDFEWASIGVAYDTSLHQIRMYINGVRVATASHTGGLGNSGGGVGQCGSYGLDVTELRIWDVSLNDTTVAMRSQAAISGTPTGLTFYMKLDTGSGTTATESISSLDGTIAGSTLWIWPTRAWASPGLEGLDRTGHLFYDDVGGDAGEIWIDIRDELSDEGFISIGNLPIGSGFRPSLNHAYGSAAFGYESPGERLTTSDGVTHIVPGYPVARVPLLFECDTEDELMQLWWRLSRLAAGSRPFTFCADVADPLYLQQKLWWALLSEGLAPTRDAFSFARLRATLMELT